MESPSSRAAVAIEMGSALRSFGYVVGSDHHGVAADIQRSAIVVIVAVAGRALDPREAPGPVSVAPGYVRAPITCAGTENETTIVVFDVGTEAAAVRFAYPGAAAAAEDAAEIQSREA